MPNTCYSLVRGRAMRVTRLDGCGAVVPGDDSSVTTDGFITISFTANTDEGETISVTNAAGKVCILDEPCPTFTGYTLEIALCGVNPALIELMTGMPLNTNAAGDTSGFRVNSKVDACDFGFAVEVWSNVPVAACDADGGGASYGYLLVPFVKGGVLGDFTIGNDAVNFTITGANSKDGNAWDVGPYDVIGSPCGPLPVPIDPYDHLYVDITTCPPPTVDCEPTAVPPAVQATGATAGTPGTFTPAGSTAPANLAALGSVTASPNTAWTTGQNVILGDASTAHWDGTTWVTGAAALAAKGKDK